MAHCHSNDDAMEAYPHVHDRVWCSKVVRIVWASQADFGCEMVSLYNSVKKGVGVDCE